MHNRKVWEREYADSKLLAKENDRPNADLVRFLRWLKKQKISIENWRVLDLGSGTGRNANYLSELGCEVAGLELSENAIRLARSRGSAKFLTHDIGSPYPFEDNYFDLILDITSSNSLNEKGREIYLKEVERVLKPSGWFFVRTLCKDGDKNAQALLKTHPGPERDTYIMPGLNLTERVFSESDFRANYGKFFEILRLERTYHYSTFNNRKFKRYYWVGYLIKN